MKIRSCNIVSFGKFKNRKIDFSDGFNLLYGENEAGKSTVMAFIKMMFYGNGGRVSDPLKNLRKKYMPWDSSLMAGSIDFSHGEKNYRLEREFKGSNATDKITLTDLDLKTEVKLVSKGDIGSEIFGLSEAAFEKSVFIGTLGAPEKNAAAEGEINGKLANITSTGDEDISLELVASRIRKAKEVYMSKSGKVGIQDKDIARLEAIEEEIRNARETEREAALIEEDIKSKEAEMSRVSALGNRYFSIMKKAELFKKKSNLEKYIEASKTIERIKNQLALPNDETAGKEYAERIKASKNSYDTLQKSVFEKEADENRLKLEAETLSNGTDESALSTLTAKKQELDRKITQLEANADEARHSLTELQLSAVSKKKSNINIPLLIIGIVLVFIFGIAAAITFRYTAASLLPLFYGEIGGAVIGIIIFAISFIFRKPTKKNTAQNLLVEAQNNLDNILFQIQESKNELSSTESAVNTIIIEKSSNKALLEAKQKELLLKQQDILSVKSELLDAKARLHTLCEPFGISDNAPAIAEMIEKLLSDIKAAELVLNMAADGTNCQSLAEAESRLADLETDETLNGLSAEEVAAAKDEFKRHTELSGKLREELATLKGKLKTVLSSGKTVPVLELERDALKEKIASQKAFCDAADIAIETLNDSFAAMRQSFGGILETETSKIFAGLTDNAYSSVDISKDLDIKVNRDDVFGAKEWQFLSAGTADQAYLALRLALTKLIEDERNTLPVIMDDSLAQYDDKRTDAALKYLLDFSKEHQLILFTCHSGIKNSAEKLGINLINM